MKKTLSLLSVALLLVISSACTHRLTDFTVISTKNVPIGTQATTIKKMDKRVKGKDTAHTILFIPLGSPNMKEAIDRAIESHPGAIGLVDGVIKSSFWTCLFYGQSSYIVEGTPIYEDTEAPGVQIHRNNTSDLDYKATPSNNVNQNQQNAESFSVLFYHEVKKGDTIDSIAEKYKVSIADIIKWNQLNSSDLTPGSKLRIMVK